MVDINSVAFRKWNNIDYGFAVYGADGKGVQLIIKRTAESGELEIKGYALTS